MLIFSIIVFSPKTIEPDPSMILLFMLLLLLLLEFELLFDLNDSEFCEEIENAKII